MIMNEKKDSGPSSYLSSSRQGNISMLELFGKDTLENLQQIISNVTGLGVITSDYKGTPLTEMTSFSPFCQCIRKKSEQLLICNLSDAFGIAQSAVTQKACIYQCPCGLMEMAIPIIIDGQFLGGFLAGQVICPDAPEDITRFQTVIKNMSFDESEQVKYQKIPKMDYDKFSNIAELVFQIINLLAEKTMAQMQNNASTSVENDILKNQISKLEYKNSLLEMELQQIKSQAQPFLMHHVINNIANQAIMEDAYETNQLIHTYHDYMDHIFYRQSEIVTLNQELETLEQYFRLFTFAQRENITLRFNIKKEYMIQRIPVNLLVPLLELAIFPFSDGLYESLNLELSAWNQEDTMFCIRIRSSYVPSVYIPLSEASKRDDGPSYIQKTMDLLQGKLKLHFGERYEIKEHHFTNNESDLILKYPMYFKDRSL